MQAIEKLQKIVAGFWWNCDIGLFERDGKRFCVIMAGEHPQFALEFLDNEGKMFKLSHIVSEFYISLRGQQVGTVFHFEELEKLLLSEKVKIMRLKKAAGPMISCTLGKKCKAMADKNADNVFAALEGHPRKIVAV